MKPQAAALLLLEPREDGKHDGGDDEGNHVSKVA